MLDTPNIEEIEHSIEELLGEELDKVARELVEWYDKIMELPGDPYWNDFRGVLIISGW